MKNFSYELIAISAIYLIKILFNEKNIEISDFKYEEN